MGNEREAVVGTAKESQVWLASENRPRGQNTQAENGELIFLGHASPHIDYRWLDAGTVLGNVKCGISDS